MLIITGKGLFRMNVSSIKIEDFASELIKVCEFIPGDIVKMSNLFLAGNESIYVYAIKDYDTSGENPENKVITIEIDRATKCIKLYAISDDLDGSFMYDRIKTFLDYFKNNKIKVDIDIIKYLKSNTGIAEQSDLIFSKDVLDNKKINTYYYNAGDESVTKCDIDYRYDYRPPIMTYHDLEVILAGLSDGSRLLKNSITTDKVANGSITPEKLSESYAPMDEISASRITESGLYFDTLYERLNYIDIQIADIYEKISNIK